jgi:hypothetical protein
VLTLPFRLRYRLAYDHRLCRAVLGVFVRALLGFAQRLHAAVTCWFAECLQPMHVWALRLAAGRPRLR